MDVAQKFVERDPSLLLKSMPEHFHHYPMNHSHNIETNSSNEQEQMQPGDSINDVEAYLWQN